MRKLSIQPGIFVLFDAVGNAAKKLEYVLMHDPARLRTISDNSWHFSYECTIEEIKIIGRVRWFGREI